MMETALVLVGLVMLGAVAVCDLRWQVVPAVLIWPALLGGFLASALGGRWDLVFWALAAGALTAVPTVIWGEGKAAFGDAQAYALSGLIAGSGVTWVLLLGSLRAARWWAASAAVGLLLVIFGVIGYLTTGGKEILTYGGWQVQRAVGKLRSVVEALLRIESDMRLRVVSPAGDWVEANERLSAADRELKRIAGQVQTMEVPPALTGVVEGVNGVLTTFGEAMTLEERFLVFPEEVRAGLLGKLSQIESDPNVLLKLLSPDSLEREGERPRWVFSPLVYRGLRSAGGW